MTVLVTGAAGFVGLNLVRALAAREVPVIALARQTPDPATLRFLAPYAPAVRFVQGDVRDQAAMLELVRSLGVRRIVHAAAVTSAEAEWADPVGFTAINLGGTLHLLEAARQVEAERFVLISSSALYGAPSDRNRLIHEDAPLQISNSYTICKQAAEQFCRRYSELYGLSTVVGRLGTAYGPMERPTGSRTTMSQVYSLIEAAREGRSLRIYGAERLRDVCYIADVAEAFARLTLADQLNNVIYNVSAGTAHSLQAIAAAVAELVPGASWQPVASAAEADLVVLPASERGPMDLSRLAQDLAFRPRYELKFGLQHYLNWLRAWGV